MQGRVAQAAGQKAKTMHKGWKVCTQAAKTATVAAVQGAKHNKVCLYLRPGLQNSNKVLLLSLAHCCHHRGHVLLLKLLLLTSPHKVLLCREPLQRGSPAWA